MKPRKQTKKLKQKHASSNTAEAKLKALRAFLEERERRAKILALEQLGKAAQSELMNASKRTGPLTNEEAAAEKAIGLSNLKLADAYAELIAKL